MADKDDYNDKDDNQAIGFEDEEFDTGPGETDDFPRDLEGEFEPVPGDDGDPAADYDASFDHAFDDSFDEGWEDDHQSLAGEGDEDFHGAAPFEKPQRNWFNIAVFGILGAAVCAILAFFLPGLIGGGDSTTPLPVQQSDDPAMDVADSASTSQSLAQQAISGNNDGATQSLLENPELLGVTAASQERADPEADDSQVFEALENRPALPEQEVDDIFAALENLQNVEEQQTSQIEEFTPQPMPQPSDNGGLNTQDLDFLANMKTDPAEVPGQEPRLPPQTEPEEETAPIPPAEEIGERIEEEIPEEIETVTPVLQEQPESVPAPAAVPVEMERQLTALNERLDQFAAQLDDIATRLESENETATPAPVPAPSSEELADLAAMEETIDRLEAKVRDLERQEAAPALQPRPRQTAPTPRRAPQPVESVQWDLRGASPGQAYVAERGTQNLRTVAVGDSLPGIGRITAISQQSGRWVVQGTSGRITQ